MALIRPLSMGPSTALGARHLVGRSGAADTCIAGASVSGEHAVFTFGASGWELRDLGSRNGTWVGDQKLLPGERRVVKAGDLITFGGSDHVWRLETDGPPSVVASWPGGVVEGDDDLLALPSLDDPVALVRRTEAGSWELHRDGEVTALTDRERVVIGEDVFELVLPGALAPTEPLSGLKPPTDGGRRLRDIALEIAVSADEEYVELVVHVAGEDHAIPPKAHHYLLLVLARERLKDAAAGGSKAEHGWLYTSDLRRMLGVSGNQFYVMCHRVRRELEALDITDAPGVIQKRTTSRQVRVGVADLVVRAIDR